VELEERPRAGSSGAGTAKVFFADCPMLTGPRSRTSRSSTILSPQDDADAQDLRPRRCCALAGGLPFCALRRHASP
jgi:hypothetical protein